MSHFDDSKCDPFIFGSGRRIYQGMYLEEHFLYSGRSRPHWAFIFGTDVDADRQKIAPHSNNLTERLFVQPEPFSCKD
jgi:hypothetical protein